MGVIEEFGAAAKSIAIKALGGNAVSSVPFSPWGSTGYGGNYGGTYGIAPFEQNGWQYSGGADGLADGIVGGGSLLDNGIVAACVDAIAQALAATPPVLQKREKADWKPVNDHPLLELLLTPNDYYGDAQLWTATVASECTTGNAFWRIVWNRARTQPREIWWERNVAPRWDASAFIKDYVLRLEGIGTPYPLQAAANFGKSESKAEGDCIVHFRHTIHPQNPRWGWTPLLTVQSQVRGDNGVATFHESMLDNSAMASLFIAPKEGAAVTPKQLDTLTEVWERKFRGRGTGRIGTSSLPVDVHKVGFSPDEMVIEKTLNYFEQRVCAALRVHPMVLGLGAGEGAKTYSNFQEAIKDFWQRTVIPMQERHGDEIEAQLFPLFKLDRNEYRIEWDRSGIVALQEDETALFARLTQAVGGPWMVPDEARGRIHLDATEGGDKLVGSGGENADEGTPGVLPREAKSESIKVFDESQHPRGGNPANPGQFSSGARADTRREQLRDADVSALIELEIAARNAPTMSKLKALGLEKWKPVGKEIKLKKKAGRVFTKEARKTKGSDGLSNQARGALGEEVMAQHLYRNGAKWVISRKDTANFTVDMIALNKDGGLILIEAKTGKVNAVEPRWEVSPGYVTGEREYAASLEPDKRKEYEAARVKNAIERKVSFKSDVTDVTHDIPGIKSVKLETYAAIIDVKNNTADIHRFDGVHERISWVSEETQAAYQGSVEYEIGGSKTTD